MIAGDEHRTLELKKTTGELKDGMHTACAFLNTEGGWLLFGVAPKSLKILGQQVTDLNMHGKVVGLMRDEYLEVPAEALREAVLNALCHRQYERYNLTIGIAIYDDRIEIENPGVLPPQITPENIKEKHGSYPYNHSSPHLPLRGGLAATKGNG